MGECGCGEAFGHYQLPGPDGAIYVIHLFKKYCTNCSAPPGISVDQYTAIEAKHFDLRHLPKLLQGRFIHAFIPFPGDET